MTAATDRELIELAAKAAGKDLTKHEWFPLGGFFRGVGDVSDWWNPLTDDGDALRLAVKLRLNILFSGGRHHVGPDRFVLDICREGDMAEIRYGIVCAAAEIGRRMA